MTHHTHGSRAPDSARAPAGPDAPAHGHGAALPGRGGGSPGVHVGAAQQRAIGLRVSPVQKVAATRTLRVLGRVALDETRVYRINAGSDGFIRHVSAVTTGSRVDEGQVLATFSAPEAIASLQAYVVALNAIDRLKPSGTEGTPPAAPVSANFQQRVERLRALGMSETQIEEMKRTRDLPQAIEIRSPIRGFVVARNVSPGQKFEKGAEWYRIADLDHVWVVADVSEPDAPYLRPGVRGRVSLPGQGMDLPASVGDALPGFDPATRTMKVRLEADNPGYLLRPEMFVDVEVALTLPAAVAVPVDAVVDSGMRTTVFVDRGEGLFEPRQVRTGRRFDDRVEILDGLVPGERIAVSATFLLDSEARMRSAQGRPRHHP